jgi:protein-disulfide isomerase
VKSALRILGVIAVVAALIATIAFSFVKKDGETTIWDMDMTMGNPEAKNHFIIYSDLACPYCIYFEEPIIEHEEHFKSYVEENDILLEVRLSDFLFEYGQHQSPASREGAIATYCAKEEGKFWDFYNLAVHSVYRDFFNENGKAGLTGLDQTDKSYWLNIGKQVGLEDEKFKSCVNNDEPLDIIIERAAKTTKLIDGMPYFKFNNYTFSGANPSMTYSDVMMYMDAGLKSK